MSPEPPKMEFPQEFERRLGMQMVEEGLAKQSAFFTSIANDVVRSTIGTEEEREAAAEFSKLFGKAYLDACRQYMANLPVSACLATMPITGNPGSPQAVDQAIVLMISCDIVSLAAIHAGDPIVNPEDRLALTTFMVRSSKFTTPRPTETVDECLQRFIVSEKAIFDAMDWSAGPEYVKWTPRYIYDLALVRTIEAMDPEFVLLKIDGERARVAVYRDIPGTEFYKVTSIHLHLGLLLKQGLLSFDNQIYRHPRYRDVPPTLPTEAIVENKIERDIASAIQAVLKEIPEDVKGEEPHAGYIAELNEILDGVPFTPVEGISARWNQFIEIMNSWMPPEEILEHEWKLNATAQLMDRPVDKVRELTQFYVDAPGDTND